MKALILAAGVGSRLQPLTNQCPKPLLPIGGEPVIGHTIQWLSRYNITEIALNLHHLPHLIKAHFGQGQAYGVQLHYFQEVQLLGTAGAVRSFESLLDTTFVVVYGDVITNLNLNAMLSVHRKNGAAITIALNRVKDPTRCGVVGTDSTGKITKFVEKPPLAAAFSNLANAGIYLVEPEVIDFIPPDKFYDFGHDLFPLLLDKAIPMFGYELDDEYLIDMGTPATYAQAQKDYELGLF